MRTPRLRGSATDLRSPAKTEQRPLLMSKAEYKDDFSLKITKHQIHATCYVTSSQKEKPKYGSHRTTLPAISHHIGNLGLIYLFVNTALPFSF